MEIYIGDVALMREVRKSIYNVSRPDHFGSIKKEDDKWEQLERTDEQLAPHFMQYLSQHHPNFNTSHHPRTQSH